MKCTNVVSTTPILFHKIPISLNLSVADASKLNFWCALMAYLAAGMSAFWWLALQIDHKN
jgi:hypothetical protein